MEEKVRDLIKSTSPKVVYYFMEGCPYCEKTTPLLQKIKKMKYPYKFYDVETSNIPEEFGIHGFPQFHIREKDGSVRVVEGSRETVKELQDALKLKKSGGGLKRTRRRSSTRRLINRVR